MAGYRDNQTKEHADTRMFQMELGMLANQPSEEYLQEMRRQLTLSLAKIQDALFELQAKEGRKAFNRLS